MSLPAPSTTPVITGLGCWSSAGATLPAAIAALEAGTTPAPVTPPPFASDHHATFPVFPASLPETPGLLRSSAMILAVAAEALADAGLRREDLAGRRIGVCIGTTGGCAMDDAGFYAGYRRGERPDQAVIDRFLDRDPAAELARWLGGTGPTLCVLDACCSGTDAIGIAGTWIREGRCDLVLAGGTDALSRLTYAGFASLLVASTGPCRPFGAGRTGLNLGEGAGILVLEAPGSVGPRRIHAQLAGFGVAADGYHPTAPHPEARGLRRALARALAEAGATPKHLAFVNAHGTGTIDNDRIEAETLACVLPGVPFVSTKGATGHTLGAAGAIEAAFTVAALTRSLLPAQPGPGPADPTLPTPAQALGPVSGDVALSQSLAFGGANSVVVMARPDTAVPARPLHRAPWGIAGMGAVGGFGTGLGALAAALRAPAPIPPPASAGPDGRQIPTYRAEAQAVAQYLGPKALRRMDRLAQLALLAAAEALQDAKLEGPDRQAIGVVVATGFGPTSSTTAFLDALLDEGEAGVSPTRFVRSVQNAVAADVGLHLGCQGPAITVSRLALSFPAALVVAEGLLAEGRCDTVLVVAADEYDPLIGHCYLQRFPAPAEGCRPGDLDHQTALPGEGATALVLRRHGPARAQLLECGMGPPPATAPEDQVWLAADGHRACGRHYRPWRAGARLPADRWGSFPTGSGLLLAAMLAEGTAGQHLGLAADGHGALGWFRVATGGMTHAVG